MTSDTAFEQVRQTFPHDNLKDTNNLLVCEGVIKVTERDNQNLAEITPTTTLVDYTGDNRLVGGVSALMEQNEPIAPAISITSSNADVSYAKSGNTIYVLFSPEKDVKNPPVISILGTATTVTMYPDSRRWRGSLIVTPSTTQGVVTFTITGTYLDGTSFSKTATTDSTSVMVDRTAPMSPQWLTPAPSQAGTFYLACNIGLTETGSGLKTCTITGSENGTFTNIVVASDDVTFDYVTPLAVPGETLTLAGTDKAGNAYSVDIDTDVFA